jgi:pimeloyl-ACP methyl ester carboxylesterase
MPLEVIHRQPTTQQYSTPLLFIHGAWHGAWCWEPHFLPYFSDKGYNVYAMSLRGHGKSTPPQSVKFTSVSAYVADVVAVADQIERETGRRPALVGHSMGGYITQKYLEKHRAPAAALLTTLPASGTLGFNLRLLRLLTFAPTVLLKMGLTLQTYPLVGTPALAKHWFFSDSMPMAEVEKVHELLQNESIRLDVEAMLTHLPRPKAVPQTPMLVLAAEDDKVFPISEERATADAYGADFVLLPDIAHDVMLDTHWRQAADALYNWLTRQKL